MDKKESKGGIIGVIILVIKGVFVGVANIIPGVSGGTIAVITGIFDRLIEAVNTLFKNFKKNIIFLLQLGIGMVIGVVGLSRIMEYCLANYSVPTNFFFIGLVAGSVPVVYKLTSRKISTKAVISTFCGFAGVVLLAIVQTYIMGGEEVAEAVASVPAPSVGTFFTFLFGGIIAAAAMVMPGISGSLIMVLLGLYDKVIAAINGITQFSDMGLFMDSVFVIIPMGIGVVVGVFSIAKLIEILLKKAPDVVYYIIFGLMIGSFVALLINLEVYTISWGAITVISSIVTLGLGFVTSYFLGGE